MFGEKIEVKLQNTFSNVNEWLKFSEAKNGVLLALSSAILMSFISLLKDVDMPLKGVIVWCFIPSLTFCLMVLLVSFLPITNKFFKEDYDASNMCLDNTNLIFYGDLRKLTVSCYLKLLYKSNDIEIPPSYRKLELDLASQIINNSEITHRKLFFFKTGLYAIFFGVFFGVIVIVFKL